MSTTHTSEGSSERPAPHGETSHSAGHSREPLLPRFGSAADDASEETAAALRRFHVAGPTAEGADSDLAGLLPALLHPYRDLKKVRHEFPLFLLPVEPGSEPPHCRTLSGMLEDAVSQAAIEGDGRILRDNLPRVERWLRAEIGGESGLIEVEPLLVAAGRALEKELDLGVDNRNQLERDFAALCAAVPANGRFLAHGTHVPPVLLLLAARRSLTVRRERLLSEIRKLSERLRSLLEVERGKDPARRNESLAGSVGNVGGEFVDTDALAKLMGAHRGSEPMDAQRRARVEEVLETLEAYESMQEGSLLTFVHDGAFDESALVGELGWTATSDEDPCAAAAAIFDRRVARFADVFRAIRIARLEVESRYDAARHGPWLDSFDWTAFSPEELLLLPLVVVLDSGERLAGRGLPSFSALLLSGRRVQILASRDPGEHPILNQATATSALRLELAYLGLGFREVFVQQSSSARPAHLLRGFLEGIDSVRPSLHVIDCHPTGPSARLDGWLASGAAIEARAHPLFRYNPERGETWARRFDLSDNPEREADWAIYSLPCRTEEHDDALPEKSLPIAFTYADFALLRSELWGHFRLVPDSLGDGDVLPLSDYLSLPTEEIGYRVPFVWAIDTEGRVRRLGVTWRLAAACLERRGLWHTLQELAGIHSEYVTEATRMVREQLEEEAREERERLDAAHAEEIERVRTEATEGAMEGLARSLLELDPRDLVSAPPAEPPATMASSPVEAMPPTDVEPAPPPASEPVEELVLDEPWVDTPLCTSCNDCLQINRLMFVYDENKQVRIGDPRSGTFAQLVLAAEKCPARCIHPGRPMNPDEPGLEELVQRAQPFL